MGIPNRKNAKPAKTKKARTAKKRGDIFTRKLVAKFPLVRGVAYDRDKLLECRDLVLKDGYTQADARKYIQARYGQQIPWKASSGSTNDACLGRGTPLIATLSPHTKRNPALRIGEIAT